MTDCYKPRDECGLSSAIKDAATAKMPLVVRGAESDLVSAEGVREFVDAVPGAQYVDVADAGHMVAGDQNDTFTAAVLTFLSEVRTGTTRR